ncbi:MAG TPA: hypothetical protein VFP88_04395 [Rhodanobacteraceae bacterium]|nr:hypothetical protein [Rhodanobacteraceae bacterium]
MHKTNGFATRRGRARGQRWLAAWRQVAQLGMLLDGRAHTWSGEAAGSKPGRTASPAEGRAAGAPRLARLIA